MAEGQRETSAGAERKVLLAVAGLEPEQTEAALPGDVAGSGAVAVPGLVAGSWH